MLRSIRGTIWGLLLAALAGAASAQGVGPNLTSFPAVTNFNNWAPSWSARFDSANSASTGTQAGYVSGDTITLATTGGVCTTAPILAVNNAAAGVIVKWLVQNPGVCSIVPTQPQAQASTSGTGTGATFTLTYQPFSYQAFDTLAAAGNFRIGGAGTEAAGANFTTTSESTCVGDKACNNVTTGANITAVGHNAVGDSGSNPFTGANIVCIGTDCMRNPLNGAGSDVGVGGSAMKFWKTSFSTAIGINNLLGASDGSSTGDSNTTLGYQILNTGAAGVTANKNLAAGGNIGPVATTATLNVWLGWDQATLATTAQKNVWLGNGVGAAATGMFESLLAGYNSGHVLTGNSNTCLGNQTCEAATSANNNTVVGHKVGQTTLASGSNILLLGTGTNTDSNTSNTIHIGAGGADIFSASGTGTAATSASIIAGTLTVGTAGTAGTGQLSLAGITSGSTAILPAAAASGTLTLQAVTDTVAVLGTTQTFTAATTFSGAHSITGTSLPTQGAGTLGLAGTATAPTFGANSEGDIWLTAAGGLNLGGQGSTNDVTIVNKSGTTVFNNPTGTTQATFPGIVSGLRFVPTGSAAPTVGMGLPGATQLGLYGTTSELFSGATDVWDYGVTTGSVFTVPVAATFSNASFILSGITTGTNADVLCIDAGKVVRLQAAASCTISSMRFKNRIEPESAGRSLGTILALRPSSFYYNDGKTNPDKNAERIHVGLIAEDVARVDPRLTIYEPDMKTPKSWHLEGMIAELVGAVQEQQRAIEQLRIRR